MRFFILILTVLVLFSGGRSFAQPNSSLFNLDLSWKDQNGKTTKLSDFRGSYVVLTMAYTECKSACPVTFSRLKKIEDELLKAKKRADFVVVSFDPTRDTTEQLSHFITMHELNGAHWHLLTGTPDAIRKMSVALGISYQEDKKTKEFSHSNKIVLLSREGTIATEVEGLASDLEPIVAGVDGE